MKAWFYSDCNQESLLNSVDTEVITGVMLFVNQRRWGGGEGKGNPIPIYDEAGHIGCIFAIIIIIINKYVYFLLCSPGNNLKVKKKGYLRSK